MQIEIFGVSLFYGSPSRDRGLFPQKVSACFDVVRMTGLDENRPDQNEIKCTFEIGGVAKLAAFWPRLDLLLAPAGYVVEKYVHLVNPIPNKWFRLTGTYTVDGDTVTFPLVLDQRSKPSPTYYYKVD